MTKLIKIKRRDFRVYVETLRCLLHSNKSLYMKQLYMKASPHVNYICYLNYLKFLVKYKILKKTKSGAKTFYDFYNANKRKDTEQFIKYYDKLFNVLEEK